MQKRLSKILSLSMWGESYVAFASGPSGVKYLDLASETTAENYSSAAAENDWKCIYRSQSNGKELQAGDSSVCCETG